jgi:enediyne biosynthesis protein E3
MATWQALRRGILTPNISETKVDVRGFHVKSAAAVERLETVGRSFLTGYGAAAATGRPRDVEADLAALPAMYRGFAYEGAGMGMAVLDGLPVGHTHHVRDLLTGPGDPHVYMVYVGVGWAMARLPRFRWSTLFAPDPLLRWLVLDGYGFHQAYFRTRRYVHEHFRAERFGWPVDGPPGYADRVIDQGIGRAVWFVGGTDPDRVTTLLDAFPESRRADLYSGTGLAATYAGGVDRRELERLVALAGPYRTQLAQGAAFAAAARLRAGLVVPHNELATEVLCGTDVATAAAVTDQARDGLTDGAVPAYATWRERIAEAFTAHTGLTAEPPGFTNP